VKCRHFVSTCAVALLCATALGTCAAGRSSTITTTGLAPDPQPVPPGSGAGGRVAAASTVKLALELLPRVSGSGNAVISPYSVQEALAMVDQGARGQTAAQIEKVLGVPSAGELAASDRAMLGHLAAVTSTTGNGSKRPRLTTANRLWLQRSLTVKARFLSTLGTEFGAAPAQLDFQGAPDAARNTINGWVAQHTAGHITGLFPHRSITSQTLLVLANAIYLKAQWQNAFNPALTAPAPFHEQSGSQVQAKFMTMEPVALPHADSASYQAVEFPYWARRCRCSRSCPPASPWQRSSTA
jgi:serine protease inhibitor